MRAVTSSRLREWLGHGIRIALLALSLCSPPSYGQTSVPLSDALDNASLTWTTSGSSTWFGQSAVTHDGVDAAQSGAITDFQVTNLSTTVTGPGVLSFYWKVSSEDGSEGAGDFLRVYVDNVDQGGGISGDVDWTLRSIAIPAGEHTVMWQYSKDGSTSIGSDAAWVDEVSFYAGTPIATGSFLPLPPGTAWLNQIDGVPGFGTAILAGPQINGVATTQLLGMPGGVGDIHVTNDEQGIRVHREVDAAFSVPGLAGPVAATLTYDVPVVLAYPLMVQGQTAASSGTFQVSYSGGSGALNYSTNSTIEALETVTVPAGTYQAVRIRMEQTNSGTLNAQAVNYTSVQRIWLADGVGIVKREFSTGATPHVEERTGVGYLLTVSGVGGGSLQANPAALSCGVDCYAYASNTEVTLTAISNATRTFNSWGGACTGAGACTVIVDAAKAVSASFTFAGTYSVSSIPFALTSFEGASVSLSDDVVSDAIALPFSFEFFGTSYSSIYISSNGFITFLPGQDDGCCSGEFLPNPFSPNGFVAAFWEDLDPRSGGTIQHGTTGESPNRVFIVGFNNIQHYPDQGALTAVTFQIKLSEGSNAIEIHCASCPSDGETHTQGIEDEGGATAYFVSGRNGADFSLSNDAVRFEIAASGSSYTANLDPGFNLIGNSLNITIDVAATFGNQGAPVAGITPNIITIWKWNAVAGRWAFYSPQLTSAGIASFAASKNYEVLAAINPGEGYWVNALGQMTLPAQTGADFIYTGNAFAALPSGFNLITQAATATPSQFNNQVSETPPAQGVIPTTNFVSLWAWDAVAGTWYFYSPLLESSGGLPAVKSYADSHFYRHFQDYGKTIGLGTGFWVNRP